VSVSTLKQGQPVCLTRGLSPQSILGVPDTVGGGSVVLVGGGGGAVVEIRSQSVPQSIVSLAIRRWRRPWCGGVGGIGGLFAGSVREAVITLHRWKTATIPIRRKSTAFMTRDIKRLKLSWSKSEEHKHSTESKIVKEHGLVVVQNYEKDLSRASPRTRT
jgi:hypothetical protein